MTESADLKATGMTFEAFFEPQSEQLFRALHLLTRSRHDAEEPCQEAFFKLWQRWDRQGAMENPSGYLYRTAMNSYRSRNRQLVRSAKRVLRPTSPDDPSATVAARDSLARWFEGLTPRQRAAVVLTQLNGLDAEDAAAALDVKPGTVYVLLSQARAALLREAEDDDD